MCLILKIIISKRRKHINVLNTLFQNFYNTSVQYLTSNEGIIKQNIRQQIFHCRILCYFKCFKPFKCFAINFLCYQILQMTL